MAQGVDEFVLKAVKPKRNFGINFIKCYGISHAFLETCHFVTFIVLVNSHQR